jgi:hypothetical protein
VTGDHLQGREFIHGRTDICVGTVVVFIQDTAGHDVNLHHGVVIFTTVLPKLPPDAAASEPVPHADHAVTVEFPQFALQPKGFWRRVVIVIGMSRDGQNIT